MSESQSGLVPYTGRRRSFAEDLLKNKGFRASVRADSSTEPLALETRRARTGAIEKVVDGNLSKMRDLETQKADASSAELQKIQQQVQRLSTETLIVSQVGLLKSMNLLIDCLSVHCEDDVLVCSDKKCAAAHDLKETDGKTCPTCSGPAEKKTRHSRVSVAEMLFGEFMEEDDEENPKISGKTFNLLVDILYMGFKGINPLAFAGPIKDEFGVEHPCDDVIGFAIKAKAVADAAARLAAAKETREGGILDDERENINREVAEEYGGDNGTNPGA